MKDKVGYCEFCINLLKKIYKKDIIINNKNDIYELTLNSKTNTIETKYEMKKYMRNIISSKNKNLINDLTNIIEIRYKLSNNDVIKLDEVYPNIDVFIAAYIKNIDNTIELKEFNYDKLFEYFIVKAINNLDSLELKKEYEELSLKKDKLDKDLIKLEKKLEKYQIARKNSFYYETYRDSLFKEMDNYSEEKTILETTIKNDNIELKKIKKQYQNLETINQISKRTNIKRLNKINEKLNDIDLLEEKIKTNELELKELEQNNKININRNNEVFKKYIDMNINEYSLIYEQNKNVDGKKLVMSIKEVKNELKDIEEKLKLNKYPSHYRKLKYFCKDNLKIYKKTTDINPKISKNIIELLEKNIVDI